MIKAFKQIPGPLQRQILCRLGYGATALLITIVLFAYTVELFSVIFCIAVMIFFAANSFLLFRRAIIGDYVAICGEYLGITQTAIKRRTKMLILKTEDDRILKVAIKHKMKKINTGYKITVYIASNTPIYEKDGIHWLHSYLAFDIRK